jgi:molybdopterin synthase catalytic subunit
VRVVIQPEKIDADAELSALAASNASYGALVSFTGRCRETSNAGRVDGLEIEHYPRFTESIIRSFLDEPQFNQIIEVLVVHRVGLVAPGETIVVVAALSEHRASAFKAVETIMDFLKTDAPFWKREIGGGVATWIEPTVDDHRRRASQP